MKPGRTPISVVVNEMSKRKTSAQVAFVDNERLLGEEAVALSVRYPDRVYARHVHHLYRALTTAMLTVLQSSAFHMFCFTLPPTYCRTILIALNAGHETCWAGKRMMSRFRNNSPAGGSRTKSCHTPKSGGRLPFKATQERPIRQRSLWYAVDAHTNPSSCACNHAHTGFAAANVAGLLSFEAHASALWLLGAMQC